MTSEHEEIVRVLQGHLDRQEWDEAIAGLNRLIRGTPQNLKLHLRLAQLYSKVGNTDKALERFQYCAQGFYEGKRYGEALAAATSILKLQPQSQFATEMVSNAKAKLGSVRNELMDKLKGDLLASLPTEALDKLASCVQLSAYPEGAAIVKEGDLALHFFLIRRGEVQVYLTDQQGKRFKLAALQQGDFFGEIALLAGRARMATVAATKPSECWVMGKRNFDRFISKYAKFKELIYRYSQERLEDTARQARASGIERRNSSRVPVSRKAKMVAQAVMLDERGKPLSTGSMTVILEDLSLSGARLRTSLADPSWVDQLSRVHTVRLIPEAGLSLMGSVARSQQNIEGKQAYAELGIVFGELTVAQQDRLSKFIKRQLPD